jgi:hypothetical protein
MGSITAIVGTVVGGVIYGWMPTTRPASQAVVNRPAADDAGRAGKAVVFASLLQGGVEVLSVDVERLRIRNGVRPLAAGEAVDAREVRGGSWGYASVADLSARMRRRSADLRISGTGGPGDFEVHVLGKDDPYIVGFIPMELAKRLSVPIWTGKFRLYNTPARAGEVVAAFALWALEPLGASLGAERMEYDVQLARRRQ